MRIADRADRGFTLVEVLVALLVTAFLLAVISGALETARARDVTADRQARALLIGEELLARRAEGAFLAAEETIEHGRYRARISEEALQEDPRRLFVLSWIRVTVEDSRGQRLYGAELRRLKALPAT